MVVADQVESTVAPKHRLGEALVQPVQQRDELGSQVALHADEAGGIAKENLRSLTGIEGETRVEDLEQHGDAAGASILKNGRT